jgi:hypothetical protein
MLRRYAAAKPPYRAAAVVLKTLQSHLLGFPYHAIRDTLSLSALARDVGASYLCQASNMVADPYRATENLSSSVHLVLQ